MAKAQISQREKLVLALGVVALVLMAGSLAIRKPLQLYRDSKTQLANAQIRLQDAYSQRALILDNQATMREFGDLMAARPRQGLTLMITQVLQEVQLVNKADFQQFATSLGREAGERLETVQLTLRGVSLEELIDLLYTLYSRDSLIILERVEYIRPASGGIGLDALMVFSAVRTA